MHRRPLAGPAPRRWAARALLCLLAVSAAGGARAETIVMKDGRRITGKIVREDRDVVVVQSGVGELELERSQIAEILKTKTPRDEHDERAAAARTAADWYALGLWAREQRMRKNAERAFERAIELDPAHADAHRELGHVEHRGAWVTPEQRLALIEAEMLAKGLVRHAEIWVTPADKRKLEEGWVLEPDGTWLDPDSARRAAGLELFEGAWLPLPEATARASERAVEALAGAPLTVVVGGQALVAGPFEVAFLEEIGAGIESARLWFDPTFGAEPGLALLGGRLAEFYVFERDPAPYQRTVPHFVELTPSLGPASVEPISAADGFYWFDPWVLSSARLSQRQPVHLRGHCLHHWGHLLLNRQGYDGRLLPPWYDEGFAALVEWRTFGRNYVFCRARESLPPPGGSKAGTKGREFDTTSMRSGAWQEALEDALAAKLVPSLDRLVRLQLPELELLDIATSMTILDWIAATGGELALRRFHDCVRAGQPAAPERVVQDAAQRLEIYERAFQAAVGTGWRAADAAWRAWFLSR